VTEKNQKPERQCKLVYFNRAEILREDGEHFLELIQKRDEDELFRLREVFEKPRPKIKIGK
jgi:hypothetical protein